MMSDGCPFCESLRPLGQHPCWATDGMRDPAYRPPVVPRLSPHTVTLRRERAQLARGDDLPSSGRTRKGEPLCALVAEAGGTVDDVLDEAVMAMLDEM